MYLCSNSPVQNRSAEFSFKWWEKLPKKVLLLELQH